MPTPVRTRPVFAALAAAFGLWIWNGIALALPIGFGINQDRLNYNEITNPHNLIYHDKRAKNEAAMIENSITAARPVLKKWFGVDLGDDLVINVSAETTNASFANFITHSIELQTRGRGTRDLFWHEYTHTNMYKHLHNWFGPAGALFHLPWLPAWFIEGLAETTSVSDGSDVQLGIERYQAATGRWPTYDRIHSLYSTSNFTLTGYATSGAFMTWLLRQGDANDFPKLMEDFFDYTLPWWWPWAAVPFNGFTPIDQALENFAGADGNVLYDRYKAEAAAHWRANPHGPILTQRKGSRILLRGLGGLHAVGTRNFLFYRDDDDRLLRYHAKFAKQSGWFKRSVETDIELPLHAGSYAYAHIHDTTYAVDFKKFYRNGLKDHRIVRKEKDDEEWHIIQDPEGRVYKVFATEKRLFWLEEHVEKSRLCSVPHGDPRSKPICHLRATMPRSLEFVGERNTPLEGNNFRTDEIWLVQTEQTLKGDRHTLIRFDPNTRKKSVVKGYGGGRPVSVAFTARQTWLLAAETHGRTLRKLTRSGSCLKSIPIGDLPLDIRGRAKGRVSISLYEGSYRSVLSVDPDKLQAGPCTKAGSHQSPLLYAMRQGEIPSFDEALKATNPWAAPKSKATSDESAIAAAAPLDKAKPPFGGKAARASESKPAEWRGRPIFLFPFVGGDDALGLNFGFVTVPLMDHQQNEFLRLSMLYGIASEFPSTDLTLTSTRFWPTLNLSAFKKQTWEGAHKNAVLNKRANLYMDEVGGKFSAAFPFRFIHNSWTLGAGLKVSHLQHFLGPFKVPEGQLNEPFFSIAHSMTFHSSLIWSSSINTRFTFEDWNRYYEYNVLGASTSLSVKPGILDSKLSLGLSGSRTRGKKMRPLREVYTPLKTFIPGSGGGFNQASEHIVGISSLFTPRYGDTQARGRINLTLPVIKNLDKWIVLVYFERLDFSAFLNYGGAWNSTTKGSPKSSQLVPAHGYNLDLQLDNKGVRFNVGLGVGQVIGENPALYAKFGFDQLF